MSDLIKGQHGIYQLKHLWYHPWWGNGHSHWFSHQYWMETVGGIHQETEQRTVWWKSQQDEDVHKKLKYRATATGWTSICEVNGKSIFDEYGKISIEEGIDSDKKYYMLESNGTLKEMRDAQLSQQMLACIRSSISDKWIIKVENIGKEPTVTIKSGTQIDLHS